jgi:SHAQKYF class myb-like DNA-binding protein
MNHIPSVYASPSFPDVRGHIISILNSERHAEHHNYPFDIPHYVEPQMQPTAQAPTFRNWFGSVPSETLYQQEFAKPNDSYMRPQSYTQQYALPYVSKEIKDEKAVHELEKSSPPHSPNRSVLGKRMKPEHDEVEKRKDLVFKGFTMEPESKRIKFVNSDRKVDGINDGPWTDREHDDFLIGLKECGSGKWRDIAEKFVRTRTRVQVASHAQKYFSKLKRREKKAADKLASLQQ